uniref:Viral late gene transcription factor 3 zinc ribbon domain-containing protein n=1 Tax=Davidia involucrata TaxID=16924 RepID=A0A5B7B909_DAVIN
MVTSISSPLVVFSASTMLSRGSRVTEHSKSGVNLICRHRNSCFIKTRQFNTTRIAAAAAADAADPAQLEITWQIVVGALAGVTPFVVAGIEFSKRIVAQRRCGVCGGSGLVLKDKYYFRCPGCGGFLPWQSWKRFFSG